MLQKTTALRKIAGLTKRIKGIQGGQGAGKTIAIIALLINHAASTSNREIYIASSELTKMRDTVVKDFIKVLGWLGITHIVQLSGIDSGRPMCVFPNKSFIRFLGLDKEDIGKGLRSDVMFINEANKIKFDTYRELTARARQVLIDFNPNKKFWFHSEVKIRTDCDSIILTYQDNEFIPSAEKFEILRYKQLGYDADGKIINQYWANMWQVYGLGLVGKVEGRIYNWKPVEYAKYHEIKKELYYGVDWGKVDPFAIIECKYSDGNLYVHELNYASENEIERNLNETQLHQIKAGDSDENEGLVGWLFNKIKVPKDKIISCDNNRPIKVKSLRRAGWEYAVSVGGKTDLINRIGILSGLNIYYTNTSKNIETEQENYCYDKVDGKLMEKPIDQDNHTIDAIAYCVQKMFDLGVINAT